MDSTPQLRKHLNPDSATKMLKDLFDRSGTKFISWVEFARELKYPLDDDTLEALSIYTLKVVLPYARMRKIHFERAPGSSATLKDCDAASSFFNKNDGICIRTDSTSQITDRRKIHTDDCVFGSLFGQNLRGEDTEVNVRFMVAKGMVEFIARSNMEVYRQWKHAPEVIRLKMILNEGEIKAQLLTPKQEALVLCSVFTLRSALDEIPAGPFHKKCKDMLHQLTAKYVLTA